MSATVNPPPPPPPPPPASEEPESPEQLARAERILAIVYLSLPFLLIYLLFKVFPTQPWPTDPKEATKLLSDSIYFLAGKIQVVTSLEERLILLVIVAGALGSYVHAASSYVDYRGNRRFKSSWMLWYLARPFIGVCLALVIYFAVRGGLLLLVLKGEDVTSARNINPFGVAAVAAMTGMFSKTASDKLAEVFETLFKSQGDANRSDSLTPTSKAEFKIDPPQGPPGGGTKVTITGSGFAAGATVSFGSSPATGVVVVNETTITATTPAGTGVVDVTVTDAKGQKATATQAFTYTNGEQDTHENNGDAQPTNADPPDDESDFDGCDVDVTNETPDEELPESKGGVA